MTRRGRVKHALMSAASLPATASARLRANTARASRFSGAFETRDAALTSLPERLQSGYDDSAIAEVSFDWMCTRAAWDYPLLYWLKTLLPQGGTILDAGGHLGTKYIAFRDVLNVKDLRWVVYDLPGIIAAARARQAQGQIPKAITFWDDLAQVPPAELMIASGVLQYLDQPLGAFLEGLQKPPGYILINKLPLRSGTPIFTIERIGSAKVPYHIRSTQTWSAEVSAAGYQIADTWPIPELSHVIATHPMLGPSESNGYLLIRNDLADESRQTGVT